MSVLWLDYESASECDLPKRGVYNYVKHATTRMLCAAYAFDDEDVELWWHHQPIPKRLSDYFNSGGQIRCHNEEFDRLLTWYVVCPDYNLPEPKLDRWYCTAAQAAANCLPRSLEDVGRAVSSTMKKDHRGKELVRKCCCPPFNQALLPELGEYAKQDVRAMRAVSKSLRELSDEEHQDYLVNARINLRGVLVDVDLCIAATKYAAQELQEAQAVFTEITGLPSVRSPMMREWVWERLGPAGQKLMTIYKDGEKKRSIDKNVRKNLLALAEESPQEVSEDVSEVVRCADDVWASSTAKFSRLASLADEEDHRVRGAFVFNGGAATGRSASYGAQVHNFPRKCAADPEAVRQSMVRGHSLTPYGSRVSDVLKSMLRPALIPAPGNVFVVADWSAIEGRVNPWLANTPQGEAKLDVFRAGKDPYVVNAAALFNVPYAEVTPDQRFVGKVQELACLGPETQVLTDSGYKAIVGVSTSDKLWDGKSWVTHQGLISKGVRSVINVCGVEVTPDHLIRTNGIWLEAKQLASSEQLLALALAQGSENLPYSVKKCSATGRVTLDTCGCNATAGLLRTLLTCITCLEGKLLDATCALKNSLGFGVKIFGVTLSYALMTRTVGGYSTGFPRALLGVIPPLPVSTMPMVAGASLCLADGVRIKGLFSPMLCRLMGGISRTLRWTGSTTIKGMSLGIYASSAKKPTTGTAEQSQKCSKESSTLRPVFDILNVGENNQFTILSDRGPLIVHNCGFLGGAGAFHKFSPGTPDAEANKAVAAWRRVNPWAVNHGQLLEHAYLRAMRNKGHEFSAGRITYLFDGEHLWYALPSGRVLRYPYAKLEEDGVSYLKASFKPTADAKGWPRSRLWKGLALENTTQATANDLLRASLRQIDGVVLHVHDEIVVECAEADAPCVKAEVERIMCTPPNFAAGLPLAVEAKVMHRYGK